MIVDDWLWKAKKLANGNFLVCELFGSYDFELSEIRGIEQALELDSFKTSIDDVKYWLIESRIDFREIRLKVRTPREDDVVFGLELTNETDVALFMMRWR